MQNRPETPRDSATPFRPRRFGERTGIALIITLLVLCASALNLRATRATYQAKAEGGGEVFVRINKFYINLNTISHVIDEPGYNSPPGSMQVYLAGAPQNFINLYGEQAEAFRQVLNAVAVDHTPKDAGGPAKTAAPAKRLTIPKKMPSTDPG